MTKEGDVENSAPSDSASDQKIFQCLVSVSSRVAIVEACREEARTSTARECIRCPSSLMGLIYQREIPIEVILTILVENWCAPPINTMDLRIGTWPAASVSRCFIVEAPNNNEAVIHANSVFGLIDARSSRPFRSGQNDFEIMRGICLTSCYAESHYGLRFCCRLLAIGKA